MCRANERQCYIVTSSLIGWAHAQTDPCNHIWKFVYHSQISEKQQIWICIWIWIWKVSLWLKKFQVTPHSEHVSGDLKPYWYKNIMYANECYYNDIIWASWYLKTLQLSCLFKSSFKLTTTKKSLKSCKHLLPSDHWKFLHMPCHVLTVHDDVIKWKHFPRYWPFVRGIHRPRRIPCTKASDAELWCFLWLAPV